MPVNQAIILASRPKGAAGLENFSLVENPVPEPQAGQVLVRHLFLSLDPYMRGRMNEGRSYAAAQALGEVMIGGTVGEVIASENPRFKIGDKVAGMGGWQTFALSDGRDLHRLDKSVPLSAYLGPVGMPGVTAWYGLKKIIAPKPGETLVVTAASGAVGSVVGQLAKIAGARVVGVAGGAAKCAYVVQELGFDACVDHRAPDFQAEFNCATAGGINGLFENVGGEVLGMSLRRLNPFARIAICGLVASGYDGTPTPVKDISNMLTMRARMQGFIVTEHLAIWPQALAELSALVASGRITYRESIVDGLAAAPAAFLGLLRGENFGKMLVRLG